MQTLLLPFPEEPITVKNFPTQGRLPAYIKRERIDTRVELITICYPGAGTGFLPILRTQQYLRDYVLMAYLAPYIPEDYNLGRLWVEPTLCGCDLIYNQFNKEDLPVLKARYYRNLRNNLKGGRFKINDNPFLNSLLG